MTIQAAPPVCRIPKPLLSPYINILDFKISQKMSLGMYKLTASLQGHEDDVRGVVFPSPNFVASVSRDSTVRLWKREDAQSTTFDDHINSTQSGFVNCVTFAPPTQEHPNGLIVSGGQETIIEVREPLAGAKGPDHQADYLLLGHSHNVCSLDAYGDVIVSGSWDNTARVWRKGETKYVLEGHEGAVWAVLALSGTDVVTGSADKTIRLWRNGKQVKVINGHTDVVRGLCRLPNGGFASCSNDGTVRIWAAEGHQLQELHGHSSFIYSVAALPTGELVSSGEDRTVRIWRGGNCIQTITHPAISVWSVAVCAETGDIVSGSSDRLVRVFSRDQSRWADEQTLKEVFDDTVAASSIPATQIGDVQKDKLPGLEALTEPGKKDGQAIMIRNGGAVEAHVWSAQTRSWSNVGTVVDAVGSGRKQLYEGKEYDFVFDVDIQEGAPPLKLPYNASENPFEAARKFLERNELPITYLDTVGNFIVKNTQGVELGRVEDRGGPDPWGTENRYRPGETSSAPRSSPSKPKYIPHTEYLSISGAKMDAIQKKVNEINQELLAKGEKEISLNPEEISTLAKLTEFLQTASLLKGKPSTKPFIAAEAGLDLLVKIITTWTPQNRLPGLDLLRLLAAASPHAATYQTSDGSKIGEILETSGGFKDGLVNNSMLSIRTYVNLFQTKEGRDYINTRFERTVELAEKASNKMQTRSLKIAYATLLLNYAILFHFTHSTDRGIELLKPLTDIIRTETDSETVFRALVALGTLLVLKGEIKEAAVGVYEARQLISKAESKLVEPRIKDVVAEIKVLL